MDDPQNDPVIGRLLKHKTGLQAGSRSSAHDVLATYRTVDGAEVFAICRHGLLLWNENSERYVPFIDIDDAGYYNGEMIQRAKSARISGEAAPLCIRLTTGEAIELPLERRDELIPDLLTIAKLIYQRVVIDRAERGERLVGRIWEQR